jgi:hypothetical protein
MPALEVLTVSVPEELPEGVRAASVRLPEAGSATDVFALEVSGMVITSGGRARTVEVVCEGMVVRELRVDLPRRGLRELYPDQPDTLDCGFRALVGVLVLPPEFELELVAVREDGERFAIATVAGRRARPSLSFEPALRPLMLTSLARAGTVWAMRLLGAHPDVVVHQQYRYEGWPARYWAHMLKVLSGPADPVRAPTSHGFDHVPWHVGPNPFYFVPGAVDGELLEWLGRGHVDRLASFCARNIEDWYAIAARAQEKQPTYFAEKNLLRTPIQGLGVADLYPDTREVFMVRDFRDMACSMIAFLRDRWVEQGLDPTEEMRDVLGPWVRYLVAGWRERGRDAHLVRYEDLVSSPAQTLRGVFEYLEIDASDEAVELVMRAGSDEEGFVEHGTSPTLASTVGRWTSEGDEAFRAGLTELFREGLAEFGYAETAAERV